MSSFLNHLRTVHLKKSVENPIHPPEKKPDGQWEVRDGVVCIHEKHSEKASSLEKEIEAYIPWRKGPFELNRISIDAEWDCRIKWNHVQERLPDLQGKTVLDIGCGNGYYLFRALDYGAKQVIGIDPTLDYHRQFSFLTSSIDTKTMHHFLAGWEDLEGFSEVADVIFCFGILYHHTDPISLLRLLKRLLKKQGTLMLETQGVAHPGSYAYFPSGKYAGAKGMWFLPSPLCHENWITRSGFNTVETFHTHPLQNHEQRQTRWAPYPSLKKNMMEDHTKTIEGHPPPLRIYTLARA